MPKFCPYCESMITVLDRIKSVEICDTIVIGTEETNDPIPPEEIHIDYYCPECGNEVAMEDLGDTEYQEDWSEGQVFETKREQIQRGE